jgi:hypothetical protein
MCACCGGPTERSFIVHEVGQHLSDEPFHHGRCERGACQLTSGPDDLGSYDRASDYNDFCGATEITVTMTRCCSTYE